jgi:hypothetical protein
MSQKQKNVPTIEEYVKQKIGQYHDEQVRAKVYWDNYKGQNPPDAISAEVFWSWTQCTYAEIETLYRIIDRLMNDDRYGVSLSKATLGLPEQATIDEIESRTKEFGELVNVLVKKKKEWEAEEEEKAKLR